VVVVVASGGGAKDVGAKHLYIKQLELAAKEKGTETRLLFDKIVDEVAFLEDTQFHHG
jgi:hypothetical protein